MPSPIALEPVSTLSLHGDSQAASLLLSSHGRVITADEPFSFSIDTDGSISFTEPAELHDVGKTLRDAVRWSAANLHQSPRVMPATELFETQWALWIELLYEPTQAKVLDYVAQITSNSYEPGVVMIDDNWSEDYGVWKFRADRFPDPKAMVDQLHAQGFPVMLWVCPYVSPDGRNYLDMRDRGLFITDTTGEPVIRKWWNGHSAVLDLTNPDAWAWFSDQLTGLQRDFGIDGFKFDGGDDYMYRHDDVTFAPTSPTDQVHRYGRFAAEFSFNELRSGWNLGGTGAVTRIADANSSWDELGLGKLVGNQLTQGLLALPFSAPDMIGGGQYLDFDEDRLDQELFVRHAQIAAVSPMMQFSAAPWRLLDDEHHAAVRAAAELRSELHDTIVSLAHDFIATGDPIIRPLEYEFPHVGLADENSAFMLGPDLLVAPVLEQGATARSIALPPGAWQSPDGVVHEGGQTIEVAVDLQSVPRFERSPK